MAGVQQAPPENPDSLPSYVEKRNRLQPPLFFLRGQVLQPGLGQLQHALRVVAHRRGFGQNFRGRRFGSAQELAEKAPFRKQLVLENLENGLRAWVRLEGKVRIRKAAPDGNHLVGLAGIGVEQMLKQWGRGPRNALLGQSSEFIVHRDTSKRV